MPIDYSKWDKLELSDDSDIEVHPNVDKNSFVKWKQRDIHEKRQQRNIEIKTILIQLTMYAKLNERVDYILTLPKDILIDNSAVVSKLDLNFDKTEKFDYQKLISEKGDSLRKGLKDLHFEPEEAQDSSPYNEMIEDLLIQIKDEHPDARNDPVKLAEHLKDHRNKIDDVLSKQTIKLDDLLYQKSLLISSDDYHTGFDRSFLNHDKEEEKTEEVKPTKIEKKSVTTVETIHDPKQSNVVAKSEPKSDKDILDELELLPATEEFAKLSKLEDSSLYLLKHTQICTEQQKDALIMTAFDLELEGDTAGAKQVIHQSLLLQYVAQLAGPNVNKDQTIRAIRLFFSKIQDKSSPARSAFLQDVDGTLSHIKSRCEVIRSEYNDKNENEEEALIQLKALDDNTQLMVNIPKEGTEEYEIFTTELSKELQDAVRTESLEEVNKVFATMKVEDAEQVLEIFNQCGVIGISGYLENENDFEELQQQYNEGHIDEIPEEVEQVPEEVNALSIEDTVD
ncbi:Cdc37 N terminal kinase binding-domain-containing protein [Scheffersomyces coipomensis]|uniref:Cdc37 N terminal kinase binding-domain-containing protein n=1 Tax=Scheffersomyces coipomensis TaxID=1788519 RepID=UPI00315C5C2C